MASNAPRAGEVLVLSEQDYRFGAGPVLARIINIVDREEYRDEWWWTVEAEVAEGTPESHGGWLLRHLYIRESHQ